MYQIGFRSIATATSQENVHAAPGEWSGKLLALGSINNNGPEHFPEKHEWRA
jgi:hypothetical protein